MFQYLLFFSWAFAMGYAGVQNQHVKNAILEPHNSHNVENYSGYEASGYGGKSDGHIASDAGKYSNGAELTSLAHSSAARAKTVLQNQHVAGGHAAYGIKSSLADVALGAAQTAQAAVIGKQAIVGGLKRQLAEAQRLLQGEIAQYQQTEIAAQAAQETAQQAHAQLNSLTAALATAQSRAHHAGQAALEADNASAAQHSMVVEAKQRVGQLSEELQNALNELQKTEVSAHKAAEAAKVAQSNAAASFVGGGGKGGHFGHPKGYY